MQACNFQDILALIENPSRYLGTEINTVNKDFDSSKLRIALAFPDLYEIGTSHFGLQILYHLLNEHPHILAERVFAPATDMASQLRYNRVSLASLESRAPLKAFDIIGFSLLYELNYTNILSILELSNIPFRAADREEDQPLIIAGGPCTCNPEPVAEFFDAIVIGDGEEVTLRMAEAWIQWKDQQNPGKDDLLKTWSAIEGVYIPSFFKPHYENGIQQVLMPRYPEYSNVKRAIVADLNKIPFPDSPIVPYGRPVHDRLRLEIARGCTRGCRFCQAGMIYRPVRERYLQNVLKIAETSLPRTGYSDLSLLSLSTGDYACIVQLLQQLMERCAVEKTAVSLPSLRAGSLTPEMMQLIKKVRKTGFTIAPEAGSQRLRNIINKNISENDIVETVTNAFKSGWSVIKLYFMIGLPVENDQDVDAIVDMALKLRKIRVNAKRKGQINVSVATFIPKPHTPFQWSRQIGIAESRSKIYHLKERFRSLKGIQFKWQNPETSAIEGIFARGDRRLSRLLETAYHKGCCFDGWSDHFRYDLWQSAWQDLGMDVEWYYRRQRKIDEKLPWDHIDAKVDKAFLASEWQKSIEGRTTTDCRFGDCNLCGTCNFETVQPIVFDTPSQSLNHSDISVEPSAENWQKVVCHYAKRGQARFFAHLEFTKIIMRAIKRSGIPIRFTEGYHPKPKIQFEDPLPIGIESESEVFTLSIPVDTDLDRLPQTINRLLPDGILIHNCRLCGPLKKNSAIRTERYRVYHPKRTVDEQPMRHFMALETFLIKRTTSKGRTRQIDLRSAVKCLRRIEDNTLEMDLVKTEVLTVRPGEILFHVLGFSDLQIKQVRIVKTSVA